MAEKKGKSEGQLIAIARDKYFKENRESLLGTPGNQYLKNRLELAFIAGCNEKSHRPLEDKLLAALEKMVSTYNKFWIGLPFSKCETMTPTEIAKVIIEAEQAIARAKEPKCQ